MGRSPTTSSSLDKSQFNKGAWTEEEDEILIKYIKLHGEGSWRQLPKAAGLLRCGKSCRLRWTNYLRPDLRRGNFTQQEDEIIIKLHSLHGNKWSLIAERLPGRTDNEIKNYWNTHIRRKLLSQGLDPKTHLPITSSITNNNDNINNNVVIAKSASSDENSNGRSYIQRVEDPFTVLLWTKAKEEEEEAAAQHHHQKQQHHDDLNDLNLELSLEASCTSAHGYSPEEEPTEQNQSIFQLQVAAKSELAEPQQSPNMKMDMDFFIGVVGFEQDPGNIAEASIKRKQNLLEVRLGLMIELRHAVMKV